MSSIDFRYEATESQDSKGLTYWFVSEGAVKADVYKIIQYSIVREFMGKSVYNLGFGDYEPTDNSISDDRVNGNGDQYRIFNTVLSTVPGFFTKFPTAHILVQGSDNRDEFESQCRQTCDKKCEGICKKFNRRMSIYSNYVSRKHQVYESDYQFLGGVKNSDGWFDFEKFSLGKIYDSIMVYQKNV